MYIKDIVTADDFRFCSYSSGIASDPYSHVGKLVDSEMWQRFTLPSGITPGRFQFAGGSFTYKSICSSIEDLTDESLEVINKLVEITNKAIEVQNKELLEKFVSPTPSWVKDSDVRLLANRLEFEFDAVIHRVGDSYIAEYKGQVWNIVTGKGDFIHEQGRYDGMYFPRMGQNLAQRLGFIPLRHSLRLSRETVKSFLHRSSVKISKKESEKWFNDWIGQSSLNPKYWTHYDNDSDDARVSVVANHAKEMLICTTSDGVHILSGKTHIIVERLPHVFYKFAHQALQNGKDYICSGTGWPLTF